MASGRRGASNSPAAPRLSLSTDRAEPIPLVRTSEDLLSRSALARLGLATEASGRVKSLSVAESIGI
jgi:hypothetical protein